MFFICLWWIAVFRNSNIHVNNLVIMKKTTFACLPQWVRAPAPLASTFKSLETFTWKTNCCWSTSWEPGGKKNFPRQHRALASERAHRLPRLSHSRQQVRPRLSYALKVSQPTHWIYICYSMTFKYIKIFAVNHLRAFMSESEHVMNINVALQCCINDYLLWLVTFQKSCMFQNIRSTNIVRYDWLGSQATFHEWMLYPSVGVIITSSGVLLIWKPRSCSPWQSINFENAKHRTTRHKKAECDVHYSKFSFFSGAT